MVLSGKDLESLSKDTLVLVIHGKAYDLTEFAPSHPGGAKILRRYGGRDATEAFDEVHSLGVLDENLSADKHLGEVDMSSLQAEQKPVEAAPPSPTPASSPGAPSPAPAPLLTLENCLNLDDIEKAAEQRLKPKAWAYYRSAADDETTFDWNRESFSHVRLRPRVLRDVTTVDLSTTFLGHKSSLPIFVSPAAMGRLANPDGEKCLARVAAAHQIPYIVSANSSVSFEEIAATATNGQTLFYQLYINRDRSKSEDILKRVKQAGFKAICLTVDAPVAGKRERDERSKMDDESAEASAEGILKPGGGANANVTDAPQGTQSIASIMGSYVDASVSFADIAWVRKHSGGLPVIVKGIMTAEDATLAAHYGASAIILSNHGGRQLSSSPSSLETLLEIRKFEPQLFDKFEVWVDGGYRRGTDVLKALALGARGVGIGRPFMYSLTFGDEGVNKVATILRDELAQNTRLIGATKLSELVPAMVNARKLEQDVYDGPYQSPVLAIAAKL